MFSDPTFIAEKLKARFPDRVLRYGLPLVSLAGLISLYYLCYSVLQMSGSLLFGVLSVILLLVVLGSAWLGYGPGVLTSAIVAIGLPHLRPGPNRSARVDLTRFALLLIISLLVSRISETRRRTEASLRRTAEDLERRVRERTEEALRSTGARLDAEERLRFVLDAAEIGYWDYDVDNDETARSRKYDEIFGYKEPQQTWSHQAFLDQIHPDDVAAVEDAYQQTLTTGKAALQFRIIWPDNSVHWLWQQSQAHRDATGRTVHVSGVITDITKRRHAEDHLQEQAQLLDLPQDAILSLDGNGKITFWNVGAERMYGWTREEAVGRVERELLKSEFPQPVAEIEAKLLATDHWDGELVHTDRDGTQLLVASRWTLRRDQNGKPQGCLEINSDITERRRIDEQLRHTQKLESLGVLAGGVAHDFNNLLTGILGNASLAYDSTPPNHPNRGLLEDAMKAAERAADLTRQMLAYAGKGRFVMRTVDLSGLVREIGGLVQTSIPKVVQLRLQLAERLPGIDADPGQLQQIIMNLVINGAEAIGSEGGMVLVRTGVQQVDAQYIETMSTAGELLRPGEYVLLEVHDTGSGMSEETLAKIFDPFFTTKFAGRGLGLSAVLGIVRSHKGALKVYSKLGSGTTFKVLFPASLASVSNGVPVEQPDLAGTGTVLVVDDEDLVRQTARKTLERFGYKTLTARDGASAVDVYRKQPDAIGLVLLDLTMPVMNGEEALRHMQSINPHVRVLLSSGYNELEAVQRFSGKGLAGFIQKPYTAMALAEKVKEALEEF